MIGQINHMQNPNDLIISGLFESLFVSVSICISSSPRMVSLSLSRSLSLSLSLN